MSRGLRSFADGIAIVTGAASGIGRALAEELAARGCEVVLADIDVEDAEAVAAGLRSAGRRATARKLDVTRFADVSALVAQTISERGRLDYLFNNAGIGAGGEACDYPLEAWTRLVEVNLNGVIHGVHAAYPAMVRQGFGHIVNTASTAGLTASPGMVSYSATKHAVVGLTKALRAEAHFHGVRVSALCPGVIRTPLLQGGRHGVLLPHVPEQQQRQLFRELFEQLHPMDPAVFARKALDQVARNAHIIIVPAWWTLLWWIERVSPALSLLLARGFWGSNRKRLLNTSAAASGP